MQRGLWVGKRWKWLVGPSRYMQNSFLELRCKFLRLLKSCPPSLKIEPHYPAACSRLNGNCSWPRLIIDNLEEAISLFDLYNHVPSLRAAAAAVQACKCAACRRV